MIFVLTTLYRTLKTPHLILLSLFVSFHILFAQTSIGFKNPDDISDLLSYRIPNWRYSTLILQISSKASDSEVKSRENTSIKEYHYDIMFSPDIRFYHESEKCLRYLNSDIDMNLNGNKRKTDSYPYTQHQDNFSLFHSNLDLESGWDQYLKDNLFLLFDTRAQASYQENKSVSLRTNNDVEKTNYEK